jgi:hypothetical protein
MFCLFCSSSEVHAHIVVVDKVGVSKTWPIGLIFRLAGSHVLKNIISDLFILYVLVVN